MIIGVGTDIVEIERIKSVMGKAEHSFLERVFTKQEIEYFKQVQYRPHSVAGGFAAKESILKALGTGLRGFSLKDTEVLRDGLGKPYVHLYNHAKEIAQQKNIQTIHVSISHCQLYATAYAVAEGMTSD